MPADPLAIVAAARSWLGVPWRHQGRGRQGVDCAGLVVMVGRELGPADYDTSAYGRRPEGHGFVPHFRACMDPVLLLEAVAGDVLVFADTAYGAPIAVAYAARYHDEALDEADVEAVILAAARSIRARRGLILA